MTWEGKKDGPVVFTTDDQVREYSLWEAALVLNAVTKIPQAGMP